MAKKELSQKPLAVNRKARHLYTVIESMECGIELKGTEVKSVKSSQFSFSDSYASIESGQIWLVGLHISPYKFGNVSNHEPLRKRRLLVHKEEIKKLKRHTDEKGLTLVPLKFYLKRGLVKLQLGICRGKKLFDRREDIKNRDLKRDADREFRFKV